MKLLQQVFLPINACFQFTEITVLTGMLMPMSHSQRFWFNRCECCLWIGFFQAPGVIFSVWQSQRTTGIDNLDLMPSFGTVWLGICEAVFVIVLLTTRWGIVHMTIIQRPGFRRTLFGRSRKHPGSKERLQGPDLWSGISPGFGLTLYYVVSIQLCKVLGRNSLYLLSLIFPQVRETHLLSFFLYLCLFLDMNYRKSFFVERPHPLLFGCKGKMEWGSLEIS